MKTGEFNQIFGAAEDVKTVEIRVLVLPTGEAIDLDSIDAHTDLGCDPLNSAEKLRPDARYFFPKDEDQVGDVVRPVSRKRVRNDAGVEAGLPQHAIDWLTNYFRTGDGR